MTINRDYKVRSTTQGEALLAALSGPYAFRRDPDSGERLHEDAFCLSYHALRVVNDFISTLVSAYSKNTLASMQITDVAPFLVDLWTETSEDQHKILRNAATLSAAIRNRFDSLRKSNSLERGPMELAFSLSCENFATKQPVNEQVVGHGTLDLYPWAWMYLSNLGLIFCRMFDLTVADRVGRAGDCNIGPKCDSLSASVYRRINLIFATALIARESGAVVDFKDTTTDLTRPGVFYPLAYGDKGSPAFGPCAWSWNSARSSLQTVLAGADFEKFPTGFVHDLTMPPSFHEEAKHIDLTQHVLQQERDKLNGKFRKAATCLPAFAHAAAGLILDYKRFFNMVSGQSTALGKNLAAVPTSWHDYFWFWSGNGNMISPFMNSRLSNYKSNEPQNLLETWPKEQEVFGRVAMTVRIFASESISATKLRLGFDERKSLKIVQKTGGIAGSEMTGSACLRSFLWYPRFDDLFNLIITSDAAPNGAAPQGDSDEDQYTGIGMVIPTIQESVRAMPAKGAAGSRPTPLPDSGSSDSGDDVEGEDFLSHTGQEVELSNASGSYRTLGSLDLGEDASGDPVESVATSIAKTVTGTMDLFRSTSRVHYTPDYTRIPAVDSVSQRDAAAIRETIRARAMDLSLWTQPNETSLLASLMQQGQAQTPTTGKILEAQFVRAQYERLRARSERNALSLQGLREMDEAAKIAQQELEASEAASKEKSRTDITTHYPRGYPASGACTPMTGVTPLDLGLEVIDYSINGVPYSWGYEDDMGDSFE